MDPIIKQILDAAWTYYDARDSLIYAWHGETFLSGYPLFDPSFEGRGNIDCSTFIHLIIQRISYDEIPYATGNTEDFYTAGCPWANGNITRGIRAGEKIRKAWGLAKYYTESGLIAAGPSTQNAAESYEDIRPGDIIFFQAPESSRDKYLAKGAYLGISHVGIASEEAGKMLHVTGTSTKSIEKPAVRLSPIHSRRRPIVIARPFSE